MVERMLAENAPAPAIVAAVRALEGVTHVTREVTQSSRVTKRDGARIRQQKFRDRKKTQLLAAAAQANDGASEGVTVTRDVTRDAITRPCDLLSIKEEGLSSEGKKVRK